MPAPLQRFMNALPGRRERRQMRPNDPGAMRPKLLPLGSADRRASEDTGRLSQASQVAPLPPIDPVTDAEPLPSPAVDEKQPYRGMGMLEAMITPHSMALDKQRRLAREQAADRPAQPTSLASTIRSLTDDTEMDEVTKLKRLADVTALAAIEAVDNDQRKTLMRVSENYMKRATFRESADMGRQSLMEALQKQQESVQLQRQLLQDQTASERDLINLGATNTERLNEQVARLGRESVSRGTAFSDEIAPIVQDRAMPVEIYARQMQAAAAARNREKGVPDPAGEQAAYENARLNALRVRIGQHVSDAIQAGSPLFDAKHPGFAEFSIPYRAKLMQNPSSYDQLRSELTSIIGPAIFEEVRKAGIPYAQAAQYIEGLTGEILGAKPEPASFLGAFSPF